MSYLHGGDLLPELPLALTAAPDRGGRPRQHAPEPPTAPARRLATAPPQQRHLPLLGDDYVHPLQQLTLQSLHVGRSHLSEGRGWPESPV